MLPTVFVLLALTCLVAVDSGSTNRDP